MIRWSALFPLTIGFAAILLLLGVIGAWSVGTQIAGAIVASGTVEVESDRQVVQHPDGGVVGQILARDGDPVQAGDVLVRLDGTFLASELAIVERQLAETFARRARLEAERDGDQDPDFSRIPSFSLIGFDEIQEQIEGQQSLFEARRVSLTQELNQLGEQQIQIERGVDGIRAQIDALEKQLAIVIEELAVLEDLLGRGLVETNRVLTLQREEAQLQGEIGRLVASVAESEAQISALGIERLRLGDSRREDAIGELRDLGFSEIELAERKLSLEERLARLDVRAPVDGVVFDSQVYAVKSVVRAAEPMMYLVPGDQPMQVSARIDPIDIEQVFPGQDVNLVFSTFNSRTTPEVAGRVLRVAADAQIDEVTGVSFYEAIVLPDPEVLAGLPDVTLLPGMPVETFLKTGDRTPLAYLTQPLTVYFNRAFREE